MKPSKRHLNTVTRSHGGNKKDRALANALLRVSEKTLNQEKNHPDDVVYCGKEEPFYGWTNAVPNPRYSGGKRPKQTNSKKKKANKKLKKTSEDGNIMWGMTGITLNFVDQQNAYASLKDMYDNYKKSKQSNGQSKQKNIIDPETYEYIPWDERKVEIIENGEGDKMKLPPLKRAPPSNLAEVLEKYMIKRKESLTLTRSKESNGMPVAASDALEYYDRYKLNFLKENKPKVTDIKKVTKKQINLVHLPSIASYTRQNNLEPNVNERSVRYVNGAVHQKRFKQSLFKEGKNAFYIKILDGVEDQDLPSMVKFEKKRETINKIGEESNRWVARVIIKEPDETGGSWYKPYKDSDSSSSVIIVPDTRWKRKLGVVEGERERIQKEMDKLRFQQQQQHKLNQMRKRLLNETVDVDDRRHRVKKSDLSYHHAPSMFSVAEAAKFSVKHPEGGKEVKREANIDDSSTSFVSRIEIQPLKTAENKYLKNHSNLDIGEPKVIQMLDSGDQKPTESTSKRKDSSKNSRLFLKRMAGQKKEKPTTSQKGNVRLPILPKQAKLERVQSKKYPKTTRKEKSDDVTPATASDEDLNGSENNQTTPLPQKATDTIQESLNENGLDEKQTNSSSSIIPEQTNKKPGTDYVIEKKNLKNLEFFRFKKEEGDIERYPTGDVCTYNALFNCTTKVIPRPGGAKHSLKPASASRKPLHPHKSKSKGQEKIQVLVGNEKGMMNSAINHINSKLEHNFYKLESRGNPYKFKTALNSAFVEAKQMEERKQAQMMIPTNLINGNRKGNVVMKRRVVPPIQHGSSVRLSETDINKLPVLNSRSKSATDDNTSQEDAGILSQYSDAKINMRHKARVAKRTKKHTSLKQKQTRQTREAAALLDNIILSGDVIIKNKPAQKLLEHSFAASITSVKPTRRIVNIIPQRVVQ